jgi:hypothetical protein
MTGAAVAAAPEVAVPAVVVTARAGTAGTATRAIVRSRTESFMPAKVRMPGSAAKRLLGRFG